MDLGTTDLLVEGLLYLASVRCPENSEKGKIKSSCIDVQSHLEEELFPGQQDSVITRLIILTYQNKEQIGQKKKKKRQCQPRNKNH